MLGAGMERVLRHAPTGPLLLGRRGGSVVARQRAEGAPRMSTPSINPLNPHHPDHVACEVADETLAALVVPTEDTHSLDTPTPPRPSLVADPSAVSAPANAHKRNAAQERAQQPEQQLGQQLEASFDDIHDP